MHRRALIITAALALASRPFRAAAQAVDPFAAAVDRARGMEQLHCLAIARGGETVIAEALRGPQPGRIVNVKSVSKTLVAAISGAVIGEGRLSGPDARLGEVAPDLVPKDADPRVANLTVGQFMTMQTGLERTSGPAYGEWVSSRDWVADALSRPFVAAPGGPMLYSTGSYHVLGAILTEVTGQSLLSLARRHIGRPLGQDVAPWTRDPQGRYMGGNNMGLSPLAMLAFGEAFRTGGKGPAGRVVPPLWVEASWQARTRSPFSGDEYGYGWFLFTHRGHRVAYARGYGGQMIWVVPSLGLTAVVTSDDSLPARSEGYAGDLKRLLTETILPAAERA